MRLATEEEFKGLFPDCELGAMPPFANLVHPSVAEFHTPASEGKTSP